MIKAGWVVVVAVAAAVIGYHSYYWSATNPAQTMLQQGSGEMEWLRREFHLNDEQFASVRKLHEEYAPECDQMCQRIAEANLRANGLIAANHSVTPEIDAALKECTRVQAECRRAMLAHVYAVADKMP